MANFGQLPIDLGKIDIAWNEMCFYLYLPIKMAGSSDIRIPKRLEKFTPIVNKARIRSLTHFKYPANRVWNTRPYRSDSAAIKLYKEHYLYLTVKHFLVNPDFWGNRGGAHADGFGTNDLNWVWYDKNPTEFNSTQFQVSDNETESLKQFESQWNHKNTVTYPCKHLLELNSHVVHRVARVTRYDMRTFVKVSLSEHKYNLVGNSHNYLFDYNWEMHDRESLRNQTHNNNADYVLDEIA